MASRIRPWWFVLAGFVCLIAAPILAARGWVSSAYTTAAYLAVGLTGLFFGAAIAWNRWRSDRVYAAVLAGWIGGFTGVVALVLVLFAQIDS